MSGTFQFLFSERLKAERKRLGLSQQQAADLVAMTREHWGRCERGLAVLGGEGLAALASAGADVLYVLTGQRQDALPAADTSEQLLLDNYRRCKLEAKQTLLQSSVLFAAGMAPASKPVRPTPAKAAETRPITQRADGSGNVQIGSIGGNYGGPALKSTARKPKAK